MLVVHFSRLEVLSCWPVVEWTLQRGVLPIGWAAVSLPAWLHRCCFLDRLAAAAPPPWLALCHPTLRPPPHLAVWNKTLPHTRDVCGEAPFDVERSQANATHCDKVGLASAAVRCI